MSAEEAALWRKLAATVTPLGQRKPSVGSGVVRSVAQAPIELSRPRSAGTPGPGLDSHWDRRLKTGTHEPDFTLDLHGLTLDQAHGRLESGLAQARSLGARLVLVVTGKPRPTEAADRGTKRGAIRAKLLDWLAAGPHGDSVAAIRQAHRRHGGDGALYLVLRRAR